MVGVGTPARTHVQSIVKVSEKVVRTVGVTEAEVEGSRACVIFCVAENASVPAAVGVHRFHIGLQGLDSTTSGPHLSETRLIDGMGDYVKSKIAPSHVVDLRLPPERRTTTHACSLPKRVSPCENTQNELQ